MEKWDKYYLDVAELTAGLSTAKKLQVGAIVVKDNRIISIGYNGTPAGWDNVCEYEEEATNPKKVFERQIILKTKPEVIHAEENAVLKIARSHESSHDAMMYTTHPPCLSCAKLIHNAGITDFIYRYDYPTSATEEGLDFLDKCRINVLHL